MPSASSFVVSNTTLGWDVGGAHLKAALVSNDGKVIEVHQVACPLWRGIEELARALEEVASRFGVFSHRHVVTMTGELVDIFPNRRVGVMQISSIMTKRLPGEVLFYSSRNGFVSFAEVEKSVESIASANWHASANLIAQSVKAGLLIDIGSTTSDFMLLKDGVVSSQGVTDAERMRFDELVYAGVVRTPLMALCQKIMFNGHWVNVAAEHFASTADVYRLTGELSPEDDLAETADGMGKTELETARRLARMIGHDVEDAEMSAWRRLAFSFREAQLARLHEAARHVLDANENAHFIGAGAGRFLVRVLAESLNKPYVAVESLLTTSHASSHWTGVCLPAVAVAILSIEYAC